MANKLLTNGVNPIILDTTGTSSAITTPMNINAIIWDSGTSGAVNDTLAMHDAASGNPILTATLAVAKNTLGFDLHGTRVNGLYLTTLSHGTVYVYVK